MPTVTIRPNSTVAVGNFSNSTGGAIFHNFINDSSDATSTVNLSVNQEFTVDLDNVSLSGATFNSFTLTVRAKSSGKGTAEWNSRLLDTVGSNLLVNINSSTSSSSFSNTNFSASFSAGFSESDVNGLQIRITTINNKQCVFAEVFVTIDYTAASGYGHNVNTVAAANIGKVKTVDTADIGKVNTVD